MDELSEEDRAAMDEGVAHVYSVIGDDTSISLQTIQDTLWYYYFDKEETVNFLLGKSISRRLALEGHACQPLQNRHDSKAKECSS